MKEVHKKYLETEHKIINLMLRFPDVIAEMISEGINPDFFDQSHRPLVQAIYHTYGVSDGKRILTDKHYRSLLLERGGRGDITIAMQVYHDCMYGVHHSNSKDDFDLLRGRLVDSFVHRKTVTALQRFQDSIKNMGYVKATRQYAAELSAAVNLTDIHQHRFLNIDELKDEYLKRLKVKQQEKEENLVCNMTELDKSMNVGFKAGHTTLIVAATGGHKTNMLLNISLRLFKQGANILFLPLEMDWEDFLNRVVSNLTGISYNRILNPPQLTTAEIEKISAIDIWIKKNNRFALLDVDERVSVDILRQELEKRANYFMPRVVVVDYLGLLKASSRFGERHDLALGELTKSLKYLGKRYGFHVITAAQLGRPDIKRLREQGPEARLDSTAVKGSHEISSDVEFIFALTTVPDESDRLKLHVIKSRYGPSGHTMDLHLQANVCRINSTETGTSDDLKSDVLGDDEWQITMNKPAEEIAKEYEELKKKKSVVFQAMDPDLLDTI